MYKAQRSNISPAPQFPFTPVNVLPPQPVSQLPPSQPQSRGHQATNRPTPENVNLYSAPVKPAPTVSQPSFVTRPVVPPSGNPPVNQSFYNPLAHQRETGNTGVYNPVGVAPVMNSQALPPQGGDLYSTDRPSTWNDPPTLKAKKVSERPKSH